MAFTDNGAAGREAELLEAAGELPQLPLVETAEERDQREIVGEPGHAAILEAWCAPRVRLVPFCSHPFYPRLVSASNLDLPEPEDGFDEKLVSDVRAYGWHCIHVADEHHPEHAAENAARDPHPIYDAAFSYTVGLWLTFAHPELVLVGRWGDNHSIVSAAVIEIENGSRFAAGDRSDAVLEDYEVCFGEVAPARRDELLTYASWANRRRPFEALQIVIPDGNRRWPWDAAYDSVPQPLLDGIG
jgi:hypothetical protein